MARITAGGTSPSMGCPCARRARRSRDAISRRGIVTRSTRQPAEGVVRDRGLTALDLDRRRLDPVDALDGGGDQLESVGGGRDHFAALLPWITGNDHEHPVEPERGPGVDGGHDVADVHRVERATEDTDSLDPGSLRVVAATAAGKQSIHVSGTPVTWNASYAEPMPLDDPSPSSSAHVLVRVWLPDRPGALGLVASRIGAVRGDIVGVDVLERGTDVAVD